MKRALLDKYRYYLFLLTLLVISISITSCSSSIDFQSPVNDPIYTSGGDYERISILSYNIQALFGKDPDKVDGLLEYVTNEGYDFVALQELFDESVRRYMLNQIDTAKFKSILKRVDYHTFPSNIYQDAGLFMMGRYSCVDLSKIDFGYGTVSTNGAIHKELTKDLSITTDFLANKSVAGSLYELNDSTRLFLFTTHLQAIGSNQHKRMQARQIRKFITNAVYHVLKANIVNKPENLVVLLTGDFNIDAYDENKFSNLQKHLGYPRDLHKEVNPDKEEYSMFFKLFGFTRRFDYIFAYDKIGPVELRKVIPESVNVTDVKGSNGSSVSDHYALKASLIIN
jgi:endonuclease/exonuclease/phosphatase family metal-dependent hydrolase